MPTAKTGEKSNADRGLERHVDLSNPTGPLLSHRQKHLRAKPEKRVPKKRKKSRKKR